MGDSEELWQRVNADEQATIARIEAIEGQLAAERRHLDEVRLFQSMLSGYDERQTLRGPASEGTTVSDATPDAAMSASQAEELDRLNRLFGLSSGG